MGWLRKVVQFVMIVRWMWGLVRVTYTSKCSFATSFGKTKGRPQIRLTCTRFLSILKQDNVLAPFKNGWPIWLKFLYCFSMERNLEQVSRIWGFPKVGRICGFPKEGRICCFPTATGNKGVFRTTGDDGRNFFLRIMDTYPMGTLNYQTCFKIGDSSL